jgi:hypothetical protein
VTAAGAAAGNTIRALYLAILFALAAKIPAEDSRSTGESSDSEPLSAGSMLPAAQSAMAVAAAFAICRAGKLATSMLGEFGYPWASLPGITALVVVALGTVFPSQIRKLAPSDDVMSVIVIQASSSLFFISSFSEIRIHKLTHIVCAAADACEIH